MKTLKFNDEFVEIFRVLFTELYPKAKLTDEAIRIFIECQLHAALLITLEKMDCPKTAAEFVKFLQSKEDFSGILFDESEKISNTDENINF